MRSYLIYEKQTAAMLPVALCYTTREVSEFMGISIREAQFLVKGIKQSPYYGIFVDEFDPAEEEGGRMHCDHLPPLHTAHKESEVR